MGDGAEDGGVGGHKGYLADSLGPEWTFGERVLDEVNFNVGATSRIVWVRSWGSGLAIQH